MTFNFSKLQRISVLLMAFVLVTMAACSSSSSNALLGKWKEADRGEVMEFMADNKLTVSAMGMTMNGTYELMGDDKMKVTVEMAGQAMPAMVVGYKLDGDNLTMTAEGGEESKYTREK